MVSGSILPIGRRRRSTCRVAYGQTDSAGRFGLVGITPAQLPSRPGVSASSRRWRFRLPTPLGAGAPPGTRGELPADPASTSPPFFATRPSPSARRTSTTSRSHCVRARRSADAWSSRARRAGGRRAAEDDRHDSTAGRRAAGIQRTRGSMPTADSRSPAIRRVATCCSAATPPGPAWTVASFRIGGVDAAGQAFTVGETDVDRRRVDVNRTDHESVGNGDDLRRQRRRRGQHGRRFSPRTPRSGSRPACPRAGRRRRRFRRAGRFPCASRFRASYVAVAIPPAIASDLDRELITRLLPSAVRVSLRPGDSKTVSLTMARIK